MKRYGIWKYFLILVVLGFGIVYSLPNLYAPDPAVQVSYTSSSQTADKFLEDRILNIIQESNLYTQIELEKDYVLIRTDSYQNQLKIKDLLSSSQMNDVVVALNLAPTTPDWLSDIGANPMKLGLDLRGGVHFLMQVDTDTAIKNRQDGTLQDLRIRFREEKIRYAQAKVDTDRSILLEFNNPETREEAEELIEDIYNQFNYPLTSDNDLSLKLFLSDLEIEQIESDAIDQNLTTLRNRVNELGVSEPIVQRQGKKRIVVQLPGIQDTAEAKNILGKTATLEFHLEAQMDTPRSRKTSYPFRNGLGAPAFLQDTIILGGDQVATAQASFDENGLPQVNITLDGDGGSKMNRATRGNIGKRLGVLFVEQKSRTIYERNELGQQIPVQESYEVKEIISLATIRAALGTTFRITGLDSPSESSELALLLRAGALAAPMTFVEERTVGPSLGADNIQAGVFSMQLGLLLVLGFILFYYRIFGIAASLALSFNIVLLVAIMSILSATLTLPGIAGIVLTVGMAVDANVLIFSRIREELKKGREPLEAIDAGYNRAFLTIWDANVTTLIVAVILLSYGTGPVKGFAITLSIGIITSMFTAIMGTRAFVNLIYGSRKNLERISI
ncbi:MAG: protein translocase subunit SecD [Pseudomonadota bacterium]|nr:protein translocase subunit SecD [Pseudomonadota bacterium]MEC8448758.1 protein translocase subunit SecD [Pseudomonadota bacterium]MEC8798778.1 protein translocase subunit SecD [Pseudomonadota bacterium]MED5348887.1 protein translocase subunit SecD [Pseudomonadota bacterium]